MANIILLGGSNSAISNGLQKGLKDISEKNGGCFLNLSLGATGYIQNFYELKRDKNKEKFQKADLIVTESNINDMGHNSCEHENLPLELFYKNLNLFYQELCLLNKKVVVLILPFTKQKNYKITNKIHKFLALKFNFNIIDMQEYYEKYDLEEFGSRFEGGGVHQQYAFLRELGKNIAKNINNFKTSSINGEKIPCKFMYLSPNDMIFEGKIEENKMINSLYNENTFRLNENNRLKFPKQAKNYEILAIHTWNNDLNTNEKFPPINARTWYESTINYSSLLIENKNNFIVKENNIFNMVTEVQKELKIDDESYISYNKNNKKSTGQFFSCASSWLKGARKLKHCDLVGLLLIKYPQNYELKIDLKKLEKEDVKIPPKQDFSKLIPPICLYKEIIEEYCERLDAIKLASLKNEILSLKNELDFYKNTQKFISHTKNYLSYQFGEALIFCSKSFFTLLCLPFVLYVISLKHKKESKILVEKNSKENHNEKEILKLKNSFTYKLGFAFIKAYKTWYKGGFVKFYFEIRKLKKELKKV